LNSRALKNSSGSNGHSKGHYLRGIVWSSGGNLIGMVLSAVTIMVAVRVVGKSEMGAYFLVMLVSTFVVVMGNWGLINTAIRFLSSANDPDRDNLSRYLITIRLIMALIVCSVLAGVLPLLFKLWPSNSFSAIGWYCLPVVFLIMLYQMGLAILSGYHKFGTMSVLVAVTETCRMTASIVLLYFGYGVTGLLLGLILSRIAAIVLLWRTLPLRIKLVWYHDRTKEILKFGGWLQGSCIMSVVTSRTADAILTTYLGTVALAIYSTALQIPIMTNKLFEAVRPVILGYVSSLEAQAANASVAAVRLLTAFLSFVLAFLIVMAKAAVMLLYSSKYIESVPILQILCFWCVFGLVNHFLSLTLIGMGRVKIIFLLLIPQFLVMVICSVVLIPKYQGVGAAISLASASLLGIIIEIWAVAGRNVKLAGRLSWAFFRSALPLFILLVVMQVYEPKFVASAALLVATGVILYVLKAVTPRDIKVILMETFRGKKAISADVSGV